MKTTWDRLSAYIALALVAAASVVASWNVVTREVEKNDPNTTVINISHTLLHSGVREALEKVASSYEAIQAEQGKRVDIRFIDVPERAYRQWVRTQLVGGTAPQIVYTSASNSQDIGHTLTGRYLVPISVLVQDPNPYNAGTSLEDVPWRYTFFDGMNNSGYNFSLAEHYGVPLSIRTQRIFANRNLIEKALQGPEYEDLRGRLDGGIVPENKGEFMELCKAVQAYAQREGRSIAPLASSRSTARGTMRELFRTFTQLLPFRWDDSFDLFIDQIDLAYIFRDGLKGFDAPEFRKGFELIGEYAQFMQPGFFEMAREDANFYFAQEKAAMIFANTWDKSIFNEIVGDRFDIVVFPLPVPDAEDPYYGDHIMGPRSEANVVPHGAFSFVNYYPRREQEIAIDFMRYLTSVPGNTLFTQWSGWLPAIFGVEPAEENKPFMPMLEGHHQGPSADLNYPDLSREIETRYHLLFGKGGIEAFYDSLLPALTPEFFDELLAQSSRQGKNSRQQQDVQIAANLWLYLNEQEGAEDRLASLIDSLSGNETKAVLRNKGEPAYKIRPTDPYFGLHVDGDLPR